jgi:hypothetical protein
VNDFTWPIWAFTVESSIYLRQHFLYFKPLPHGQGSLRPTVRFRSTDPVLLAEFPVLERLRVMASILTFGFHSYSRLTPNLTDVLPGERQIPNQLSAF